MNYRDRYGTNTYTKKGKLVTLGDLDQLTPAQRKRTVKKEHRGKPGKTRPSQKQIVRARHEKGEERRSHITLHAKSTEERPLGPGSQRALERTRKLFGSHYEKVFDDQGRRHKLWKVQFGAMKSRKARRRERQEGAD